MNWLGTFFRLLAHLDDFIKAASGELGFEIGKLLCVVFSGGPSISLSLKEEQIFKILHTVFVKENEDRTDINAALLDAISELMLVRTLSHFRKIFFLGPVFIIVV